MMQFPNVQRIAQEEIDKVIGGGRLPTFEERDVLPYLTAIVKEILRYVAKFCPLHYADFLHSRRWRNVTPLGKLVGSITATGSYLINVSRKPSLTE